MNFFSYDSGFSRLVRKVWSCLILNALWLLLCLPVVTAGASTAAFAYSVRKHVIHDESYAWASYWKAFKREFKQATLIWLIFLGIGVFLGWDFYFFFKLLQSGNSEGTLLLVIAIMLVFLAVWFVYAFSYLSLFSDKIGKTLKNSFLLMLPHPLANLRIIILIALMVLSFIYKPVFLVFLPVVSCWLNWLSLEKIFKRIAPDAFPADEEPDEEENPEEISKPKRTKKIIS